jgi:HlyD family secretion protein
MSAPDCTASRTALSFMLAALLAACQPAGDAPMLGTLEWDRIAVPAEASEPVLSLAVREGEAVKAGQLLLTLDGRRIGARVAQAQAAVAQQEARVSELVHGARSETLDAARAAVASALASEVEAGRQFARQSELAAKQLVARASLDVARANRDRARAQVAESQARLRELTQGTRSEQLAQAEAALAAARAALEAAQLDHARLQVRAPRAGRVDALPFKAGDQPPPGAAVASLLVGEAPYARVFVPESRRVALREGQRFLVHVQGRDGELPARLRSVAREPSFTPYYALTGDDASRLVYRAELELDASAAAMLPAGLPVQVRATR